MGEPMPYSAWMARNWRQNSPETCGRTYTTGKRKEKFNEMVSTVILLHLWFGAFSGLQERGFLGSRLEQVQRPRATYYS